MRVVVGLCDWVMICGGEGSCGAGGEKGGCTLGDWGWLDGGGGGVEVGSGSGGGSGVRGVEVRGRGVMGMHRS